MVLANQLRQQQLYMAQQAQYQRQAGPGVQGVAVHGNGIQAAIQGNGGQAAAPGNGVQGAGHGNGAQAAALGNGVQGASRVSGIQAAAPGNGVQGDGEIPVIELGSSDDEDAAAVAPSSESSK